MPALAALLLVGLAWGLTIPLTRISVSTGHDPLGLIFWQLLISALVLGLVIALRGRRPPYAARHLGLLLLVAVLGTLLPNSFSYRAAAHLPAGVMAIAIAMVPMFALPVAVLLRLDRVEGKRLIGIALGAAAIALIYLPETALPRIDPVWILVALVAPLCYGLEGNSIAKIGTGGLDPVEVLFGASLIGVLLALPLATTGGRWVDPFADPGAAEFALLLNGFVHAAAYTGYVYLVGRAGSVFAAQVSYIVTGSGVVWSMLLLGESYTAWVWAAFVLLFAGLSLVTPRPPRPGQIA
ncbi:MAG: DMT family transporter [Rubricella sp.]